MIYNQRMKREGRKSKLKREKHQLIVVGEGSFVLRKLKLVLSIGLSGHVSNSGQLRVDGACWDLRVLLFCLRVLQLAGIPFRCVGIFLRTKNSKEHLVFQDPLLSVLQEFANQRAQNLDEVVDKDHHSKQDAHLVGQLSKAVSTVVRTLVVVNVDERVHFRIRSIGVRHITHDSVVKIPRHCSVCCSVIL